MTMTFKEALIAHLQGEKVEAKGMDNNWVTFSKFVRNLPMAAIDATDSVFSKCEFKVGPRTILVNGVEVPAGEKEAPSKGATYYVPDQAEESLAYDFSWGDDDMDARFLERGLVYLDKESAIARAKAMLITQEVK